MLLTYEQSLLSGLKPDRVITCTEWADSYLHLPRESTSEYGKYRSIRTPFVVEPLNELSPHSRTPKVVIMKPTQLCGTTIAIIFLFTIADIAPAPCMIIMPTGDLAKSFSKKKISPTLIASPQMNGKIKDSRSRDSGNTILEKTFTGGSWRIAGSNSGAIYRSESVKYIILDDYDGFDSDIEGEGDPQTLADRRTGSFARSKVFINSTPTIKGLSNIEREFESSSQGYYNAKCPYCKKYQFLVFRQLKFDKHNLSWVYYECEHCHKEIEEHNKPYMLENGKYIHKFPEREERGFTWNALFTPLGWKYNWKKIAKEFLGAKNNREKLKVWTNTLMAETFEEEGEQPQWEKLSARSEPYEPMTVPTGGLLMTAGVDVHLTHTDIVIKAWGRGEENWLIYYIVLYEDPKDKELWKQLDTLLYKEYKHASGIGLRIVSMSIDSKYAKQEVYNYCRKRSPIVVPIHGSETRGRPILNPPTKQDVSYRGKKIKNGVELWSVGTDTAKLTIYNRLKLEESGPGYYHTYIGVGDEYFHQLTAEKLVKRFNKKGYPIQEWHNVRRNKENHVLDCEVYCFHAAIRAGLPAMNWDSIEKNLKEKPKQKRSAAQKKRNQSKKISQKKWFGG